MIARAGGTCGASTRDRVLLKGRGAAGLMGVGVTLGMETPLSAAGARASGAGRPRRISRKGGSEARNPSFRSPAVPRAWVKNPHRLQAISPPLVGGTASPQTGQCATVPVSRHSARTRSAISARYSLLIPSSWPSPHRRQAYVPVFDR